MKDREYIINWARDMYEKIVRDHCNSTSKVYYMSDKQLRSTAEFCFSAAEIFNEVEITK